MRNTLVTVTFAACAALGVAWWTAPESGPASQETAIATPESAAPALLPSARPQGQDESSTDSVVREVARTGVKRPMEHGVVPMTSLQVGWPQVSVQPDWASEGAEGLDWDTVAWSGEADGEVIDAAWSTD